MLWTLSHIIITLLMVTPGPAVSSRVSPRVGMEPLTVNVSVAVMPDPHNMGLCVRWDSEDGGAGLTCQEISPSRGSTFFQIKRLEAGHYSVGAYLLRGDTIISSNITTVEVISQQ